MSAGAVCQLVTTGLSTVGSAAGRTQVIPDLAFAMTRMYPPAWLSERVLQERSLAPQTWPTPGPGQKRCPVSRFGLRNTHEEGGATPAQVGQVGSRIRT